MLTADRLRDVLNYDPASGIFRWNRRLGPRRGPGEVAGCREAKGYVIIGIDGRNYKAHRLAWLWMNGSWPAREIDHINLIKDDNRWDNIREATRAQNNTNTKPRNRLGFKGVIYMPEDRGYKRRKPYQAKIKIAGRSKFIGYYATAQEAHEAYLAAAQELHGEFARGE